MVEYLTNTCDIGISFSISVGVESWAASKFCNITAATWSFASIVVYVFRRHAGFPFWPQ